ncbi:hypothetical protein BJ138DRAFT_1163259 [Hygrophoropsis aurantiaca]|uniref:Uncharacterized protein n=1 Tax=Hygrophoropsis aurantiaca TaxID=72124 RepID=A0ACB7ZZN9_9AGAM|nr:hypothetical protein BJ138DRAFT_1163259 [Hygrophoropsis aurantiaca]
MERATRGVHHQDTHPVNNWSGNSTSTPAPARGRFDHEVRYDYNGDAQYEYGSEYDGDEGYSYDNCDYDGDRDGSRLRPPSRTTTTAGHEKRPWPARMNTAGAVRVSASTREAARTSTRREEMGISAYTHAHGKHGAQRAHYRQPGGKFNDGAGFRYGRKDEHLKMDRLDLHSDSNSDDEEDEDGELSHVPFPVLNEKYMHDIHRRTSYAPHIQSTRRWKYRYATVGEVTTNFAGCRDQARRRADSDSDGMKSGPHACVLQRRSGVVNSSG